MLVVVLLKIFWRISIIRFHNNHIPILSYQSRDYFTKMITIEALKKSLISLFKFPSVT